MKLVADLHIHSHYSRATSKNLDFEHLTQWAQIKGVNLVGTGDIAHPGWLQEMVEKLEPAEEGLFRLKSEIAAQVTQTVPAACRQPVRFLLAGEISNIYKRHGRTRKVHNVIFAPTLTAVAQIQVALEKIGNIRSDGRPILGLDSRDLLEIILEVDARCHLIPAHIWTPWFSMLGSKSGFDSVEECFGDLTPHIFALETGLSSDPPMNWRVSNLDRYTLVSHSDAHSPPKLAREATLFEIEPTYDALFAALKSGDPEQFKGTLEFFPEEGKYHIDGHRKCNIAWDPAVTLAHKGLCEVCGKPVTVGVLHRVEELADRPPGGRPARTHPFHSLIPLPEILGELNQVGPNTKTVQRIYDRLLAQLGSELTILLETALTDIAAAGEERLAQGIGRMRRGEVLAQGGYDGEFGVIKLFAGTNLEETSNQFGFFGPADELAEVNHREAELGEKEKGPLVAGKRMADQAMLFESTGEWESRGQNDAPTSPPIRPSVTAWLKKLNPEQRMAVTCTDRHLVIVAGPGTGKTRTLTVRLAHLVESGQAEPESMLAITFTNKAAKELQERLGHLLGEGVSARILVRTFHAFGVWLLREWAEQIGLNPDFVILNPEEQRRLLAQVCPELKGREVDQALERISQSKNRAKLALLPQEPHSPTAESDPTALAHQVIQSRYQAALRRSQALDFDDLVAESVRLLTESEAARRAVHERFAWIAVDEYQDVNPVQVELLRLLTQGGANLCVIGDPDQAIYGFRGADPRYFQRFELDFPGAQRRHLSHNYRSTQLILDAATQVIARNPERDGHPIRSDFAGQVKLTVYQASTDKAEAEYTVHQIERMMGGTSYFSLDSGRVDDDTQSVSRGFGDFAILYRLNAQARLLIQAFDRSGIPYQSAGQTVLADRAGVREILAHLWLRHIPTTPLAWETVLTVDGMPPTAQALTDLLDFVRGWQGDLAPGLLRLATDLPTLNRNQRQRLVDLTALWRQLDAQPLSVGEQVGMVHSFQAAQDATLPATEDLRQLQQWAGAYGRESRGFLDSLALYQEVDATDLRADRVTLMTLHAAKGLEFPVVFVVGCEEGLLPYLPAHRAHDLAEERRLIYVGMTRAQEQLILTHAKDRFFFGQQMENPPSRFVGEIEDALKELRSAPKPGPKAEESRQLMLL